MNIFKHLNEMNEQDQQAKHTEGKLQADCFAWFHNTFVHLRGLLFHVPNGGTRNPIEANKLKAMGVVPGIPDIIFMYRGSAFAFEFKKPDGTGTVSPDQKKVIAQFELQDIEVWVIESMHEFKSVINEIVNRTTFEKERLLSKSDFFYRHSIFEYLYNSLDAGRVAIVAEICHEENVPRFCRCVAEFIETGHGLAEEFEILFTPDYKGIYKKSLTDNTPVEYLGKSIL